MAIAIYVLIEAEFQTLIDQQPAKLTIPVLASFFLPHLNMTQEGQTL